MDSNSSVRESEEKRKIYGCLLKHTQMGPHGPLADSNQLGARQARLGFLSMRIKRNPWRESNPLSLGYESKALSRSLFCKNALLLRL